MTLEDGKEFFTTIYVRIKLKKSDDFSPLSPFLLLSYYIDKNKVSFSIHHLVEIFTLLKK